MPSQKAPKSGAATCRGTFQPLVPDPEHTQQAVRNPVGAYGLLALADSRSLELFEARRVICHVHPQIDLWDERFDGGHVIGGIGTEVG